MSQSDSSGTVDPSVTADYYADLCEVPKVVVRES
jgi:hypothetical protein